MTSSELSHLQDVCGIGWQGSVQQQIAVAEECARLIPGITASVRRMEEKIESLERENKMLLRNLNDAMNGKTEEEGDE